MYVGTARAQPQPLLASSASYQGFWPGDWREASVPKPNHAADDVEEAPHVLHCNRTVDDVEEPRVASTWLRCASTQCMKDKEMATTR